jgi:hypothetical protein
MNQITVDQLDFDSVKANLKLFLQGQTQFDSYDFEGSAMSIILDVLAYNTVYNALYTNLAVNESFIDSASKRSSVVSLAKGLGYTANSRRSARATLSITVTTAATDTAIVLTLPRGTVFNGTNANGSWVYQTLTDYSVAKSDGAFTFPEVEVTEGTLLSSTYVATTGSQYVIPTATVDTSTISVLVRPSPSSAAVTRYYSAEDILRAKSTDAVYFIKQRDDLLYEIYFGDNSIGKAVTANNAVRIEYLAANGAAANGSTLFAYQSGWRSDIAVDVETVRAGYGGTEEEDIESIRMNAPKSWVTQNRAVTTADYENILRANYPSIESIHAWGGQDNVPKVYGKVFISAKPYNAESFALYEKQAMIQLLQQNHGVVSITPEIVDPTYLNVELTCNVYYNTNTLRWTPGELATLVRNKISEYASTLNRFDSVFRYSRISALVDSVDSGIVGNSSSLRVRSTILPQYGLNSKYALIVNNPATPGTFYSTRFYVPDVANRVYFKDDSLGTLKLYSEDIDGVPTYIKDIGTIDYTTCAWNIPALTVASLHDSLLEFVFTPRSNDVASNLNLIVTLKSDLVQINTISDKVASGESTAGSAFVFTNVR